MKVSRIVGEALSVHKLLPKAEIDGAVDQALSEVGLDPVSYTHLDVYKRQVTGFSLIRLIDPPGEIVAGTISFGGEDLRAASEERLRDLRGDRIAKMCIRDRTRTDVPRASSWAAPSSASRCRASGRA